MGDSWSTWADSIETLQFLVGSEVRVHLLSRLSEGRADARTLVDCLDVPHSTVQRNLNKLEDRGWISATVNRRYYTTPVGQMVLEGLDGLLNTVESVDGLAAFVGCVDFDQFGFELDRLSGATCVVADAQRPSAPLNEFVERLAGASGFTLVAPNWNPAYSDVIDRQLSAGQDVELVTTESQQSLLRGPGVAAIDDNVGADGLSVALTQEQLDVGVAILADRVLLAGYQNGALRVLVETDDERVREWTRAHVDSIESQATPLQKEVAEVPRADGGTHR